MCSQRSRGLTTDAAACALACGCAVRCFRFFLPTVVDPCGALLGRGDFGAGVGNTAVRVGRDLALGLQGMSDS